MRPRLLKRHRTEPAGLDADADPGSAAGSGEGADTPVERRFDDVLARELDRADEDARPDHPVAVPGLVVGPDEPPDEGVRAPGVSGVDFWERFDRARAEAELNATPPAAVTAVVGPLGVALPVARRCQEQHWMGSCDVFVLSETSKRVPGQPDWQMVETPSRMVSILEDAVSDFPLFVVDVPTNLPRLVEPLVRRLRGAGVGLVHYVLDGDPDDEDLATWYGVLGSPSVLNLAGPLAPDRVVELVDRGEPVVSVAGRPLTAELLIALRTWAD